MSKANVNDLFDPSKLSESSLRKYQVHFCWGRATSSWSARRTSSRTKCAVIFQMSSRSMPMRSFRSSLNWSARIKEGRSEGPDPPELPTDTYVISENNYLLHHSHPTPCFSPSKLWSKSVFLLMMQLLQLIVSFNFLHLRLLWLQILAYNGCLVLALPFQIGCILLHGLFYVPVGVGQIVPCHFSVFFLTNKTNTE